jgi:hypothetical protein
METGKHHRTAQTLDGQDLGRNLTRDGIGAFQRGARGQLNDGEEITLILRRDKARGVMTNMPMVAAISAA